MAKGQRMWRTPVFWFALLVVAATIAAFKFENSEFGVTAGVFIVATIVAGISRRHWFSALSTTYVTSLGAVTAIAFCVGGTEPYTISDVFVFAGGVLPVILFAGTLPMFALRLQWGWRLRNTSGPTEATYGLRMIDLFEFLTLAGTCMVALRMMEAIDGGDFLTPEFGLVISVATLASTCLGPATVYAMLRQKRWRWTTLLVVWAIGCAIVVIGGHSSGPDQSLRESITAVIPDFIATPIIVLGFLITLRWSGWHLVRLPKVGTPEMPRERTRLPVWFPTVALILAACGANWLADRANADRDRARQFVRLAEATGGNANYFSENTIHPLDRIEEVIFGPRTTDGEVKMCRFLPNIKRMSVSSDHVTDDAISAIVGQTKLKTLILSCPKVTNVGVGYLSQLPRLSSLSMSGAAISDDAAGTIARMSLSFISINNAPVGDETCRHLKRMQGVHKIILNGTKVTDEGVREFRTMSDLDVLQVANADINGSAFDSGFENLLLLDASHNHLSLRSLRAIAELPRLRILHLDGVATVDDDAVRQLSERDFIGLSLASTAITDNALRFIVRDSMSYLDVSDTGINGSGFDVWSSKCQAVTKLNLSNTRLVDENLSFLRSIQIRELYLGGTGVTASGLINSGVTCMSLIVQRGQFSDIETTAIKRSLGCSMSEGDAPPH